MFYLFIKIEKFIKVNNNKISNNDNTIYSN